MIRHPNEMINQERQIRGGNGLCKIHHFVQPGEIDHCRMFATVALEQGISVGEHMHEGDAEYFWILSGQGIVTEVDGEKIVNPGDFVATGDGESHAIRNENSEPLVFVALIIVT
jgi:mannose-6-phosphate isomerase-like protein (cupin superfamily)